MGLLLCKINSQSPFFGYAGSKQLTEKKVMRDVFKKGDAYFNTGDLMAEDQDNFISFKDRVGDTFRWGRRCILQVASAFFSWLFIFMDCISKQILGHDSLFKQLSHCVWVNPIPQFGLLIKMRPRSSHRSVPNFVGGLCMVVWLVELCLGVCVWKGVFALFRLLGKKIYIKQCKKNYI